MDDFFFSLVDNPAHESEIDRAGFCPGVRVFFARGFLLQTWEKAGWLLVDIRGYDLAVSTKKYSLIF